MPFALPPRWHWPANVPDPGVCGSDLTRLSPVDYRKLGRSALLLWRYLERERGYNAGLIYFNLTKVAEKLGLNYRTAKWAISRLEDCGMIEKFADRTFNAKYKRARYGSLWWSKLTVRVWGAWDERFGDLVPRQRWEDWSKTARAQGRPKKENIAPGASSPHPNSPQNGDPVDQASTTYGENISPTPRVYIPTTTVLSTYYVSTPPSRGAAFDQKELTKMEIEDPPPTTVDLFKRLARPSGPKPSITEKFRALPLDPAQTISQSGSTLTEKTPPINRVRNLAASYRHAVKEVYGTTCNVLKFCTCKQKDRSDCSGECIVKSKVFPALTTAAEVLIEHEIAPEEWAMWRIKNAKKMGQKVPPITLVFNAHLIHKYRGWFSRDYDGPRGNRLVLKKENYEQLYRNKEVWEANRGVPEPWKTVSAPAWYREMREQEVAAGHVDPTDFWPKVPK